MSKSKFIYLSVILWIVFVTGMTYRQTGSIIGNGNEDVGLLAGFTVVGIFSSQFLLYQQSKLLNRLAKIILAVSYFLFIPVAYIFSIGGLLTLGFLPIEFLPRFITAFIIIPFSISIWASLAMLSVIMITFWLIHFIDAQRIKKESQLQYDIPRKE